MSAFSEAFEAMTKLPSPPLGLTSTPITRDQRIEEITAWWQNTAQDEIDRTVPKMVEYGSNDLSEIGRQMSEAMGLAGFTEQELAELGIYFYLVGKFARWTSAIREGRRVSDDTLFDIGVYVRMAQRIREKGGLIND